MVERSARLSAQLRESLRAQVAELTRWMHCYYSNLIEGQQTRVRDIEAVLKQDFAQEPRQRDLQQLSLVHLEIQCWAGTQTGSPFAPDFIGEMHRRFYAQLPATLQVATTTTGKKTPFTPGELRDCDVKVGTHLAPPHELVAGMLSHFQSRYESADFSRLQRIIAIGASHHCLAWIHPFRDGNGRVVRLFLTRSSGSSALMGAASGRFRVVWRGIGRSITSVWPMPTRCAKVPVWPTDAAI